jgi:hypothetical protein
MAGNINRLQKERSMNFENFAQGTRRTQSYFRQKISWRSLRPWRETFWKIIPTYRDRRFWTARESPWTAFKPALDTARFGVDTATNALDTAPTGLESVQVALESKKIALDTAQPALDTRKTGLDSV